MNAWGLIIIGLGIILIIIGFKGSQHSVINAFKGIKPSAPSKPGPGRSAQIQGSGAGLPGTNPAGGGGPGPQLVP